jgi:hypothetical protein
MPTRRVIVLILLFWLATTSYVAYRDLWPRLHAAGPPPVGIDLADEASQTVPIRWSIRRGEQKVGRLVTTTRYIEADDTFRFVNEYKQLVLDAGLVKGVIPDLTTIVRVTRGGDLREQSLDGKIEISLPGGVRLADATARIQGRVIEGQLIADCEISSSIGSFQQRLDPVPVPRGQPFNPLLPVNRITGVEPGLSWMVALDDPLRDAIVVAARKVLKDVGAGGFKLPDQQPEPLFAEVLSDQQDLDWHGHAVPCWVIEYRQTERVGRTWVRVSDGKVLKQEAFLKGETMTIERDE